MPTSEFISYTLNKLKDDIKGLMIQNQNELEPLIVPTVE